MISFRCHSCGKAYKVKAEHGVKTIKCPGCKVPIVLPFGMAAVTPPIAPAPLRKPPLVKQGSDAALVLTAVLFGLPLLASVGWLGLALVFAPSKEVRERMRVEQAARNAEVGIQSPGAVDPDNRREWISLTYGSIIAYKNERMWTDTDKATGKILSEMEFRGKTNDYVELFNLNPAARDLIRLYKDRMECKQDNGWAVIGGGHWESVNRNTSVANQTANERQNQSKISNEKKNNSSPTTPGMITLRGALRFGTRSSVEYQKLQSMINHGDTEAFSEELGGLLEAGDAVMFGDGKEVFISPAFSLLLIKVRRRGDTNEYWTNSSSW